MNAAQKDILDFLRQQEKLTSRQAHNYSETLDVMAKIKTYQEDRVNSQKKTFSQLEKEYYQSLDIVKTIELQMANGLTLSKQEEERYRTSLKQIGKIEDYEKGINEIVLRTGKSRNDAVKMMETLNDLEEESLHIAMKQSEERDKSKLKSGALNASLLETVKIGGEAGSAASGISKGLFDAFKAGEKVSPEMAKIGLEMEVYTQLVKLAVDRFISLQKSAEEFRRSSGLTIDQSKESTKQAEMLNRKYQQFGVTVKDALESLQSLVEEVGSSGAVDNMQEMVDASTLLKANFGVATKDSVGFLFQMQKVGKLSSSSAADMAGYAAGMAKATGVPLPKVMADVAHASSETLSMIRGNVEYLTKAAVQARLLGVSLNESGKAARGFLNFQTSINDEMEASVLTGKNLNFQYARQLAWQGKIAESQREALRVVKSAGDFTKMNAFQQEAVAKAAGYTVDQMQKIIANEKMLANMSVAARAAYDKRILSEKQMQSAMTNISNSMQKFLNILADQVLPVVEVFAKGLEWLAIAVENIGVPVIKLTGLFKTLGRFVNIGKYIDIGDIVLKVLSKLGKFGNFFTSIMFKLKLVGGVVGKVVGVFDTFGKAIPLVGEIIMVIQALWSVGKSLFSIFGKIKDGRFLDAFVDTMLIIPKMLYDVFIEPVFDIFNWVSNLLGFDLGESIKKGLSALGNWIGDFFGAPFKDSYDYILSFLGGKSPSKLGLSIVNGIKAIGSILYDALISPFVKGFNFIKSLIPDAILSLFGIGGTSTSSGTPTPASSGTTLSPTSSGGSQLSITDAIVQLTKTQSEQAQLIADALSQLAAAFNSGIDINNFDVMKFTRKISMTANKLGATVAPI